MINNEIYNNRIGIQLDGSLFNVIQDNNIEKRTVKLNPNPVINLTVLFSM